jgi:hypothetical protein
MQYSGSIEAHRVQLEYLTREGTDIDEGPARLFGTDSEDYQKHMTGRNFRIFLSPQSPHVQLKALAGHFIAKLEKQTGYRFYWQGACHYNTAHPHAHLLINGIDRLGRDITFSRDIVKTFMRETARDLCTVQMGRRTRADLDLERERELSAPRFTRLDEQLRTLCGSTGWIQTAGIMHEKERIAVRLETLRKLTLCTYEDGGYRLKPDWDEQLKNNGRYNAFLKARDELRYSDPSRLTVYSGAAGDITGRITRIYRTDGDASDHHAVLLEGLDGRAWFVPLFKKPELRDGTTKGRLDEGELVTLKTYGTQQGRLTPFIFKLDANRAAGAARKNGYTGKLAGEITAFR